MTRLQHAARLARARLLRLYEPSAEEEAEDAALRAAGCIVHRFGRHRILIDLRAADAYQAR